MQLGRENVVSGGVKKNRDNPLTQMIQNAKANLYYQR